MDVLKICSVDCGAKCCKKYWITPLPEEAEKIAKGMGLSNEEFIKEKCVLHLQLFPSTGFGMDSVSMQSLPENVLIALKESGEHISDYFIVLPSIAFKRNDSACVFLKENKCSVYENRPKQCASFPVLSFDKDADLKKAYPFCKLLDHIENRPEFDKNHFRKVSNYFENAKSKGIESLWPVFPEKGVLLLSGKEIGEISLEDFVFSAGLNNIL